MNDEQQLWRDVQKFMNQFPGFITVSKKIGQIGDLEAWQAAEQRKLDTIIQEIEKQRQAIKIERDAANVEAARKSQELEASIKERNNEIQALETVARANYDSTVSSARKEADRIIGLAARSAREVDDVIKPRRAALEAEIATLMDKMLAAKDEHEATQAALAAAKDQHAAFIKHIVGTAGG